MCVGQRCGVYQDWGIRVCGPQLCLSTLRLKGPAGGRRTAGILLKGTNTCRTGSDMSEFFSSCLRQTGNPEGNCFIQTKKYIGLCKLKRKSWPLFVFWEVKGILLFPPKFYIRVLWDGYCNEIVESQFPLLIHGDDGKIDPGHRLNSHFIVNKYTIGFNHIYF